jgi:hypothetical protein
LIVPPETIGLAYVKTALFSIGWPFEVNAEKRSIHSLYALI